MRTVITLIDGTPITVAESIEEVREARTYWDTDERGNDFKRMVDKGFITLTRAGQPIDINLANVNFYSPEA